MLAVVQKGYSLPIMESGIKVDGNVEVFPDEFCGVTFKNTIGKEAATIRTPKIRLINIL